MLQHTAPWAIPQKVEQGGGHQDKLAHMHLLPDVEMNHCFALDSDVSCFLGISQPPTRLDVLDEPVWSTHIFFHMDIYP